MIDEQNLLSLQEAAKVLAVKPVTLRKWDREGKLKAIRIGTRNDRRYLKSDLLKMISKPDKKIKWQEYIRSGMTYHMISPVFESFSLGLKQYFGKTVDYLMGYFEHDTLFWYYDSSDLYEVGKNITNKLISSPEFADKIFDIWDKKTKEVFNLISVNKPKVLAAKTDKELADLYEKYSRLITDWYSVSLLTDPTDESLTVDISNKVKEILKKKLGNDYSEKEFTRVYGLLTSPKNLSYLNHERKMVLELALDIQNGDVDKNTEKFENRAQEIVDKFWWTGLGWSRGEAKNVPDIKDAISELASTDIFLQKELEKINHYSEETESKQKEVNQKYNFSNDKELKDLLELFDRLVIYHDLRKEGQVKETYWEYQFFNEVSSRKDIPYQLLDWCENTEIVDLLNGKEINEQVLNQRSSRFLYLNIKGVVSKLSGKEAEKKHAEILGMEMEETKDLQGISASSGTAIGEAYIALTPTSAMQIKPGQILVTGMTTPDFVPALKKAAAVVTDEGGITCHAAIVSREMGIPCIVGTKYATRLIKDGNKIEVKANHGVVRILES